jgi:hypothetical protein
MDLEDRVAEKVLFTYKMDDQKIGRGPVVLVFQKEVLW